MATDRTWPPALHDAVERAIMFNRSNTVAAAAALEAVGPDLIQIGRDELEAELERLGEHAIKLGRENRVLREKVRHARFEQARAESKVRAVRAIFTNSPMSTVGTEAAAWAACRTHYTDRVLTVLDGTTPKEET